ncbi:diguanylate cyclase [Aphanothece hegewaldii CCALA 016]|uniref:Diguanylate cyclase n=1 Tax=Aphanothece hegewaldii CCALA 016 TaxID=2107694 RepID=A0A2T1M168_9CHRO|nr:EAL domain-containing protein [Aphanothece hegewaldii]PSF38438.1 diguanylate cyclase [Aphanothece hegewaldii CCALA 016]
MLGDKVPYYKAKNLTASLRVRVQRVLIASLLITLAIMGVRQTKGLQVFELAAYDHLVRRSIPHQPDERLLIVGISESDIQKQKRWPLSDQIIARLLQKLQQHQPKVIGLDVYRDIPQGVGHEELVKQLQAKNVITIAKGEERESDAVSSPPEVPSMQVGFSDLIVDIDNVVRRNLLYVESPFLSTNLTNPAKFYSFALRVSLKYLNNLDFQVTPDALKIGSTQFNRLTPNAGGYQLDLKDTVGWQILLRYHSPNRVARQVSLTEVLEGKIDPSWLKNRVILIGYTAPSVKDVFATPYSATENTNYLMSGVMIHAQMVSQILSMVLDNQPPIRVLQDWVEWFWILGWSILGGMLIWQYNRPLYALMAVAIATISLWGISLILFNQSIWLPVIGPTLGLLGTGAVILVRKTYHSLYYDSLTNLPNRRSFLKQIRHLKNNHIYSQHPLAAILFLDLDRFKLINEGLCQQAGDYLLIETAHRLEKLLKTHGQIARVGGDEFAIWLRTVQNIDEVTHLANQLQEQLKQPLKWAGHEIFTSVSIGIALERIDHLFQSEELLRHAHIAMYRAKEKGKDRYEMFSPVMKSQAESRWQLETGLRKAIQQQEFKLYYQPIISLRTHKIVGFEALIRWPSSDKGFISPGQFIPIAEETGLIVPLGEWILKEACCQMKQWHQQFPRNPPLLMSVNLSSRQFNQPDLLIQQIQNILKEMVDEKQRNSLKLEITESVMFNNVEGAIQLLHRLRALGLRLSIDDFGTGYSNLSYLHRFPIDTLKVDQSFVRRMHEENDNKYAQIVRTVVMLGHNLGLEVVAEGIETEEQMRSLLALNCEFGQGYFFAKPLPPCEATALLESDPQW